MTEDIESLAKVEVIELPSGKHAIKQQLKGKDFFQFQAIATKSGGAEALQWVMAVMFSVDGKPLTIDTLNEDMSFEDVACLSAIINQVFTAYLPGAKSS